jgi:exonuclease III
MRITTWNLNKAAYGREKLWNFLKELDSDICLFQEVYMIPYEIRKNYHVMRGEMNAVLVKKNITTKIEKENIFNINSENAALADYCVSCKMDLFGKKVVLISVYNYSLNRGEFEKFLLKILLNYIRENRNNKIIIIGGDFNMDERFPDTLKGWRRLAKNMKKELYQLGYKEILSEKFGSKTTFIAPRNEKEYQLDYLFVPKHVKVINVTVGDKDKIFKPKPRLSDHLPIILEIKI